MSVRMNLLSTKKAVAGLLDDYADIFSSESIINSDGTTSMHIKDLPDIADLKCRLSFPYQINLDRAYSDDYQKNPERIRAKIFFEADAPISKGDYLKVRRFDLDGSILTEYFGVIGAPVCFPTHKEVVFERRSNA